MVVLCLGAIKVQRVGRALTVKTQQKQESELGIASKESQTMAIVSRPLNMSPTTIQYPTKALFVRCKSILSIDSKLQP